MIRVLELFAGIGACSKALERLNIEHEIVDAVEIDKYAIKSFNAIHGTNFEPQDITKWNKDIKVDLIMHGSPCQDFSLAGLGKGGDKGSGTRSSLMYETLRIVEKLEPEVVIWENVKNILSKKHIHNFNAYLKHMEDLGYYNSYKVLNAKNYGIPQNRERVFVVSLSHGLFEFPPEEKLNLKLKDLLENDVDEKYYLSDKQINGFIASSNKQQAKGNGFKFEPLKDNITHTVLTRSGFRATDNFIKVVTANKQGYDTATGGDSVNLQFPNSLTRRGRVGHGVSQTLQANSSMGVVEYRTKNKRIIETAEKSNFKKGETEYLDIYNKTPRKDITSTLNAGTDSHQNNIIATNYRIRKLTPKECWRLMGFDDEDFEKASKVCSNTQLYKQAGNSIVVNVLEAILNNLFKK